VTRYLAGELAPFFELPPFDVATALDRPLDRPRPALAAALGREAERMGAPKAVFDSLERLARPESRVVVTGQQPGLLLGPAYTLSKALSAIRLAGELDTDERPVVPVFWVASQDHDTGEVDHANLLDGEERLHRVRVELPREVPSGRAPFRPEWREAVGKALLRAGGRKEHLSAACVLLQEAAQQAESFADPFVGLLYRLLGEQGIIVLDPTRPALVPLFRDVLRRELDDTRATVEAIVTAGEELRRMGFDPQLGRGRDATNLFLDEEEDGLPRRRLLRFDGVRYSTASKTYSKADIAAVLDEEPWRLTPAAGLRPVAQDAVLPTAAFLVGPGELRYLAQLRGVYRHHAVSMPLIRPRASAVVLEPPARRILDRYGLEYSSYAQGRGEVLERVLLERHGHDRLFSEALRRLAADSEELRRHVSAIDPSLERTVERARLRMERTTLLLKEKAAAALVKQDRITRKQFERLEAHLFPAGVPQERYLSPFSYFLKFGIEPMMDLYRTLGASGEHVLRP
jgi:bacillithiol biosynthesis cysteine-adding enzyme BshC